MSSISARSAVLVMRAEAASRIDNQEIEASFERAGEYKERKSVAAKDGGRVVESEATCIECLLLEMARCSLGVLR